MWALATGLYVNQYFQAVADFLHKYTVELVTAVGTAQLD
jgi:hypothetical protein